MTLTACISLFYAFLSITSRYYKPDIGAEFNLEVLGDGMLLVILLITMLLVFLVQYVNRFMIRNQQKEFAVQSIMGMEQSMIAGLFFIETLVMGLFWNCIRSYFLTIYYCHVAADFSEAICIFVYVVSRYCISDYFLFLHLFCNRRIVPDSNDQKD